MRDAGDEAVCPGGSAGNRIVKGLIMVFHRAMLGITAAALSVGTAFATSAAPASQGAEPSTSSAVAKDEPMVCRSLTVSGSRMPQRVCATKTEWEEHATRASQGLEDSQQESDRRSLIDPKSLPR